MSLKRTLAVATAGTLAGNLFATWMLWREIQHVGLLCLAVATLVAAVTAAWVSELIARPRLRALARVLILGGVIILCVMALIARAGPGVDPAVAGLFYGGISAVGWIAFDLIWPRPHVRHEPVEPELPAEAKATTRPIPPPDTPRQHFWIVFRPGHAEVTVWAFEQDVSEYSSQVGGAYSRMSAARIQEIGEEWLYDRASFRLIRQADGSLKLGSPWDAVTAQKRS